MVSPLLLFIFFISILFLGQLLTKNLYVTPLFLFNELSNYINYYLGPLATLADNFFFIIDLYIGNRPVVVHLDFAVLFIYYNGIPFSQSLNHSLTHFFLLWMEKKNFFFFSKVTTWIILATWTLPVTEWYQISPLLDLLHFRSRFIPWTLVVLMRWWSLSSSRV